MLLVHFFFFCHIGLVYFKMFHVLSVWVCHVGGKTEVREPSPAASTGACYQEAGMESKVRTQTHTL